MLFGINSRPRDILQIGSDIIRSNKAVVIGGAGALTERLHRTMRCVARHGDAASKDGSDNAAKSAGIEWVARSRTRFHEHGHVFHGATLHPSDVISTLVNSPWFGGGAGCRLKFPSVTNCTGGAAVLSMVALRLEKAVTALGGN
jgi:hypothetical protein